VEKTTGRKGEGEKIGSKGEVTKRLRAKPIEEKENLR